MKLNLAETSKVIGWWVVIIAAGAGLWSTLNSYYATRLMLERSDFRRLSEDISNHEVIRDHYQMIEDRHTLEGGRMLTTEEKRRKDIANRTLDRLYRERQIVEDTVRELEK